MIKLGGNKKESESTASKLPPKQVKNVFL